MHSVVLDDGLDWSMLYTLNTACNDCRIQNICTQSIHSVRESWQVESACCLLGDAHGKLMSTVRDVYLAMYILANSATAASRASAPATATVCLAFIAVIMTAWCAVRAAM